MREATEPFFGPTFNRSIKLRARDQRLSSDGGVLLLREADHRLGLIGDLAAGLRDPRRPECVRYHLDELLRERIFARALGYKAAGEVDLLAHDPAMRIATRSAGTRREVREPADPIAVDGVVDGVPVEGQAKYGSRAFGATRLDRKASACQQPRSRGAARDPGHRQLPGPGQRLARGRSIHQYNGYYKCTMYHPLVAAFSTDGDYDSGKLGEGFVHATLRAGKVHTASGALRFIPTALKRCSGMARSLDVRMDAGFMIGKVLDPLTDDGIRFIGRLRRNQVLERMAAPHLLRPVGRPPKEGYEKIVELGVYQAAEWRHAQRVVLVVVDRPDPETGQLGLFPRYFFLATTWNLDERTGSELLQHYRRRGTFEDRIGELSQAVSPRHVRVCTSPGFAKNEIHFGLSLLSYNLLSILRGELENGPFGGWDIARLQRTVLKTVVRVTKGGHRLTVDVAHSAVHLWSRLILRMKKWSLPSSLPKPVSRRRKWVPPPQHVFRSLALKL